MNKTPRVSNLTAEQRVERSKNAVKVRWENDAINGGTLKAKYSGELKIGDMTIPCAVLEDGRRVLSETGIANAMGSHGGHAKLLKKQAKLGGAEIPVFLASSAIDINKINRLTEGLLSKVRYRKGRQVYTGYTAEVLPEVCEIWLNARDSGLLTLESQLNRAKKAEVLIRALAKVGINALVDEATGYQEERDRTELQKLLSKYISEEYMQWQKRFPQIFYREAFRLFGWKFDPSSVKRPILLGKFTNDYVYDQLPEGVLEELRKKNPPDDSGNRKQRHHQFLTSEVGIPHLDKHLTGLILLMRASSDIIEFKRLYDKAMRVDMGKQETI